jgi:hypothetical protein
MIEPSNHPDLAHLERHLLDRRGRPEGREIRFLCPAHEDTNPSARWSRTKATWYCDVCQKGGGWRDLARRLGLHTPRSSTPAPGAPTPPLPSRRERRNIAAAHPYTDAAGNLLYEVLRLTPKAFACRRPDASGGWIWNLQAVERVLYRLPDLLAAIARDELVFLVEGEKDADALAALGFTATTQAGGAGKWRPAYNHTLRQARVVVIPDHDEAGHRHADAVLAALRPHAAELRRLDLPNLPDKGDTSDWLAARRAEGLPEAQIRCRLLDLALAAPNLLRPAPAPAATPAAGTSRPLPLDDAKPSASSFPGATAPLAPGATPHPPQAPAPGATTAPAPAATAALIPGAATPIARGAGAPLAAPTTLHGTLCLADVQPHPVAFLWQPYVPLGKLTLLDGDPGQGKSWVTAALAAAGSRGHALPGCAPCEPFRTLFLCEDEIGAILRPRLDLLHADPTRIHGRDTVSHDPLDLSTAADIAKLDEIVAAFRPRLLVIDPVQAFLGRTDFYRPNEVRGALHPLLRLAHQHNLALLVLRHITKARSARSIYAGQGSIDFTGAARSVLLAGSTTEDPNAHALVHIKSNLSPLGPAIAYRLDPTFAWQGPTPLTADDLLAPAAPPEDLNADREARAFLRALLAGPDPLPARVILAAARDAGIAPRTLKRAKHHEGIRTLRHGFGLGSVWLWSRLPPIPSCDTPTLPPPPEGCHPETWPPSHNPGPLRRRRRAVPHPIAPDHDAHDAHDPHETEPASALDPEAADAHEPDAADRLEPDPAGALELPFSDDQPPSPSHHPSTTRRPGKDLLP